MVYKTWYSMTLSILRGQCMYPNFNFNEIDVKTSKHDPDIIVIVACVIIFICTVLFVLVPEKNIEITGNDLKQFNYALNEQWLDNSLVKADSLQVRITKADNLMGKQSIKDKMQFLLLVNSISEDQKSINKVYLQQIITDRQIIMLYLIQLFEKTKNNHFSCVLAQCKDKEYKTKQEELQTIKLINLKLESYYKNLVSIQHHKKDRKLFFEQVVMNINKALTDSEQKQYEKMQ